MHISYVAYNPEYEALQTDDPDAAAHWAHAGGALTVHVDEASDSFQGADTKDDTLELLDACEARLHIRHVLRRRGCLLMEIR